MNGPKHIPNMEGTCPVTIGSEYAIKGEAGADLKYVEHPGAAIGAGRDSLKDLEKKWSPTVLVCWKTAALPRLEPEGLCGLGKRTTG